MQQHFSKPSDWLDYDRRHLWHPYTSIRNPLPCYAVESASGVRLTLADGRELIDGMSSWWSAIHGYNHPALNRALLEQSQKVSHVMFGGIAHQPATELAKRLVDITPEPLQNVFLADSGSIAVEVAMKMALQYHFGKTTGSGVVNTKQKMLTIRGGYHGDPFGCMSVCDPENGMHHLFSGILPQQIFAPRPEITADQPWHDDDIKPLRDIVEQQSNTIAALILEPIVQGAGGMRFYHPEYLRHARTLCDAHNILLIADEIATGFGRSGKMFACEHADVVPDILCVGKALTGGMMTLAATLCTDSVADGISQGEAPMLMHGPTFMGNPLACAVACASLDLLSTGHWQLQVATIETQLSKLLKPARSYSGVADVRVMGAIGVIEMRHAVDMAVVQAKFVERGVWVRPFGKLIYIMPPFVISESDLERLAAAMLQVAESLS